jgi:hypothetical protein
MFGLFRKKEPDPIVAYIRNQDAQIAAHKAEMESTPALDVEPGVEGNKVIFDAPELETFIESKGDGMHIKFATGSIELHRVLVKNVPGLEDGAYILGKAVAAQQPDDKKKAFQKWKDAWESINEATLHDPYECELAFLAGTCATCVCGRKMTVTGNIINEQPVDRALEIAAEILLNFKSAEPHTDGTLERKLEEWQACYAKLFTQMNDLVQSSRKQESLSQWQQRASSEMTQNNY